MGKVTNIEVNLESVEDIEKVKKWLQESLNDREKEMKRRIEMNPVSNPGRKAEAFIGIAVLFDDFRKLVNNINFAFEQPLTPKESDSVN